MVIHLWVDDLPAQDLRLHRQHLALVCLVVHPHQMQHTEDVREAGAELEQRAREGSENELENSTAAWHRLLALFTAVHDGIEHPRLTIHAHDGSLFDPDAYLWIGRPWLLDGSYPFERDRALGLAVSTPF